MLKMDLLSVLERAFESNGMSLQTDDVVVIASKVVALSQGREVSLEDIVPSERALSLKKTRYGLGREDPRFIELVLREADQLIDGPMLLTLKDTTFIASAGIDRSNAPEGKAILWPSEPWEAAWKLYEDMKARFRVRRFGLIITDSQCQPLRWGTTGLALSWAGFSGVEDLRGKKDIYGRPLQVSQKAVADNLSSAAQILMGEGNEQVPFVVVRGAPVHFNSHKPDKKSAVVAPSKCLYSGLYGSALKGYRPHQ